MGPRSQNPQGSGLALEDSKFLVRASCKGGVVGMPKASSALHVRRPKTFVSGDLYMIIIRKGTKEEARDTCRDFLGHR